MLESATRRLRTRRIQRRLPFLNVHNLTVRVHNERYAIGDTHFRDQHAIQLGNLAHMVAEHRIADVEFLLPVRESRPEIGTNCQYLYIHVIVFCDTRLVRGYFLRSTTGERGWKESHDDDLLAAKIGKLHRLAGFRLGKCKVGSLIANFEMSFWWRDLLGRENSCERRAGQKRTDAFHVFLLGGVRHPIPSRDRQGAQRVQRAPQNGPGTGPRRAPFGASSSEALPTKDGFPVPHAPFRSRLSFVSNPTDWKSSTHPPAYGTMENYEPWLPRSKLDQRLKCAIW